MASDDWDSPRPTSPNKESNGNALNSTGTGTKSSASNYNGTNGSKSDTVTGTSTSGPGSNKIDADNEYQPGEIKIILVGDSAVGKSKLIERFLCNNYSKHTSSTYAVNIFSYDYNYTVTSNTSNTNASAKTQNSTAANGTVTTSVNRSNAKPGDIIKYKIDFWDTAGQEQFSNLHPSFFFEAHLAILVFDVTRKITYKNLEKWWQRCQEYRSFSAAANNTRNSMMPCIVIANKIDSDPAVTSKKFQFPLQKQLPFFFTSAADGTNVVRIFEEALNTVIKRFHESENNRNNPGNTGANAGKLNQEDDIMADLMALIRD